MKWNHSAVREVNTNSKLQNKDHRIKNMFVPVWVASVPSFLKGHWDGRQAPQEPHWLTSQSRGQAISHLSSNKMNIESEFLVWDFKATRIQLRRSYLWIEGGFSTDLQFLLGSGWPLLASTQVALRVCIPPPHWTGYEVIGSEHTLHLDTSHLYLLRNCEKNMEN